MKRVLIIKDVAKFITFRNRKVRTPVTLNVNDDELKALKIGIKMAGIQKWEVKASQEKNTEVIDYDYVEPDEVVIEELEEEKEPKTILEKLMKNGESE